MNIFNFVIKHHKHKWEKQILAEFEQGGVYILKVGEKCITKDCNYGGYNSVYFIKCVNKPDVIDVE